MEDRNPNPRPRFLEIIILPRRNISDDDQRIKSMIFEPISAGQDRISDLPEALLLDILSLLPTKDAIKTCVLSKRWSNIWTFLPSLSFKSLKNNPYNGKFVKYVDKTLMLHRAPKVSKLFIEFEYDSELDTHVDGWVRFATSAQVQQLCLKLKSAFQNDEDTRYVLPQHFFVNEFITLLDMNYCKIMPKGLINWSSLKSLSIGQTLLTKDVMTKVFLGSPRLEFLELYHFCVDNGLDVESQSLKKLVIREYRQFQFYRLDYNPELELEIMAPNIQELEILGNFYWKKCRLKNVASLVEAKIDFYMSMGGYEGYDVVVRGLIESLHRVKELTVGRSCLSVLSKMSAKHLPSPLSKCKCLTVKTILPKCAHGITILLQSLPCLETLIIDIGLKHSFNSCIDDGESYWKSKEMFLECLWLHLKTVIICGGRFTTWDPIISLAQSLLRNARVLEKMVFRNSGFEQMEPLDMLVAQKLLSSPRSSPHAVVMFPHQ